MNKTLKLIVPGNHLVIHDGFSSMVDAMVVGLPIQYNTACVGVKYSDNGVEVSTREVPFNTFTSPANLLGFLSFVCSSQRGGGGV